MSAKVFVGNLSYSTTADDLKQVLAEAGTVTDVYIPTDRESGRPRGFAFATFSSEAEAAKAIELFHQRDVGGRRLNVNAAEERPRGAPRPGGFGGAPGGPRPYGGGGGGGFGGPPRSFGGPPGGGGGGFGGPPRPFGGGGGGFGGPPRPFGAGGGGPSRFEADRGNKTGPSRRFNEKRGKADDAKPAETGADGKRERGGGGSKRWRGDVDDY